MKTFWCSMAPETGPARVVLVDAESEEQAGLHQARFVKPGDETLIIEIPPEELEYRLPRNRVLSDDELRDVGAILLADCDPGRGRCSAMRGEGGGSE
jgi:hypothetical protein